MLNSLSADRLIPFLPLRRRAIGGNGIYLQRIIYNVASWKCIQYRSYFLSVHVTWSAQKLDLEMGCWRNRSECGHF